MNFAEYILMLTSVAVLQFLCAIPTSGKPGWTEAGLGPGLEISGSAENRRTRGPKSKNNAPWKYPEWFSLSTHRQGSKKWEDILGTHSGLCLFFDFGKSLKAPDCLRISGNYASWASVG